LARVSLDVGLHKVADGGLGFKVALLLKTEDLTKDYRVGPHVVHALRNVSLAVEGGEFVAIMGPSGSGKSTLMNLLGCLDKPTNGHYLFDGEDISHLTRDQLALTRNSKIGFVFQTFNLLSRNTALDNVELPLLYGRTARKKRRLKAEAVLDAVGLSDRGHHQPSQLSGGQQLILADEPTGAIDTRTGVEIMSLFQRLNREGITIVIVTHEPEIACFANRILRFRDGRLINDEMVKRPKQADEILAE